MNTAFAARRIAQWAGIAEMAIGYAGLKDRHAVTRQRFSVHLPKKVAPDLAALEFGRACACSRHALACEEAAARRAGRQSFRIDPARGAGRTRERSSSACRRSPAAACPTISASSASAATATTSPMHWRCSPAAASAANNARSCCRPRVRNCSTGCWRARVADGSGTTASMARSGCSTAAAACSARSRGTRRWPRAWPRSTSIPAGRCGARADCARPARRMRSKQRRSTTTQSLALRAGLEAAGLKQERRALRLRPRCDGLGMARRRPGSGPGQALRLRFSLPAGCYATTVLAELGEITDASTRAA